MVTTVLVPDRTGTVDRVGWYAARVEDKVGAFKRREILPRAVFKLHPRIKGLRAHRVMPCHANVMGLAVGDSRRSSYYRRTHRAAIVQRGFRVEFTRQQTTVSKKS